MISSGINLVMTVIGFTVSALFIVFVCTRLICARIQLTASRRSLARTSRSDLSILERGLHGLEPCVVANFPTKKYRDLCISSKENAQCTVCLAEYHEEDTLRVLPICGHFFHATCIDIWLHQHFTCPVCRISLRELPERKRFMQPMFCAAIRSQYGMRAPSTHYCHCLASERRSISRSHDNQMMDAIQEVQCQTESNGVEGGDRTSGFTEGNPMNRNPVSKQVESPSSQ